MESVKDLTSLWEKPMLVADSHNHHYIISHIFHESQKCYMKLSYTYSGLFYTKLHISNWQKQAHKQNSQT